MGYRFRTELWMHTGDAAWHFVTLPFDIADEIDERAATPRRGFGAVRVKVTIGATAWATSIFPDSARRSYVLPIKKAVRSAEDLHEGDHVEVSLELA